MSKFNQFVCGASALLPLLSVFADAEQTDIISFTPTFSRSQVISQEPDDKLVSTPAAVTETSLSPFTGKVRGRHVRVRTHADLESRIVKELEKNELLTVVGEKGDFYAVEAPANNKAYVFRSFVLDGTVEGNHVNVRLYPDIEAPVLGRLNKGDQVKGVICPDSSKWLEIDLPPSIHFYVAKEYIENIGGPEVRTKIEKQKKSAMQMLDDASFLTKVELRKSFTEMDIEKIQHTYNKIIADFPDFPEYVEQAKTALTSLQDAYLQKKIAFLEAKVSVTDSSGLSDLVREELVSLDSISVKTEERPTDKMLLWEPLEEALYLDWVALNENHNMQEYYEQQQIVAASLSGILESYPSAVKNKPGSHILKNGNLPVAYVYSTRVNLENLVGQKVSLRAVERPNNHFAFPAYFVLSQE